MNTSSVRFLGNRSAFWAIILTVVMSASLGCQKSQTAATKPFPKEALQANIKCSNAPAIIKRGGAVTVPVVVKNIGNATWPMKGQEPDGKYMISLSYHWLDQKGNTVVNDGPRTPLPYDLDPRSEVALMATVYPPAQPGDYVLEFDMVQELVSWFQLQGSQTCKTNIKVE